MARRPQPNRRRGLIRAGLTALVLFILLIVAVLVVASLTATTAKAPVAPATPGRLPTAAPTVHPAATAGPTASHKKKDMGAVVSPQQRRSIAIWAPTRVLGRVVRNHLWRDPNATRSGGWVTRFLASGAERTRGTLLISSPSRRTFRVGNVDTFVRPVWAHDGHGFLFIRVQSTSVPPGPLWTLLEFDVRSGRVNMLDSARALNMTPLGWSGRRVLYALASTTDTSVFSIYGHRSKFVTILIPQPLVSASLSPEGRYIAFNAPTNCFNCTLDVFDLSTDTLWNGPTGLSDDSRLAWSARGSTLVTMQSGRLLAVSPSTRAIQSFGGSTDLNHSWDHEMLARVTSTTLHLTDSVTGTEYQSRAAS